MKPEGTRGALSWDTLNKFLLITAEGKWSSFSDFVSEANQNLCCYYKIIHIYIRNDSICLWYKKWPPLTDRPACECLRVSRGMGQQWPAVGTGNSAAAALGDSTCGITHTGGRFRATGWAIHKLESNYTKYNSCTIMKALGPNRLPHLRGSGKRKDRNPLGIWLLRSADLIAKLPQDCRNRLLEDTNKILSTRTQGKEQWPPQETETDLPKSVLESPVQRWGLSGLPGSAPVAVLGGAACWHISSWKKLSLSLPKSLSPFT